MEIKVSLFIIGLFIVGLAAYYLKYKDEATELRQYDYSKSDSAFYSLNFESRSDSLITKTETVFRTKELPKGKININRADVKEFSTLPGIGIKTAEKIVEYRNKIKTFNNVEQLKDIKGISRGKFDKLKDYILVK